MNSSKRVLLLSPAFFGYEHSICEEMRSQGFEVDFFDERPSNSAVVRAILRVKPKLLSLMIDRHYAAILRAIAERNYEFVIVIKGETTPATFLTQVRMHNPQAKLIFYSFDAIGNSSNCVALFPLFDRLFSFDFLDTERFPTLEYKPLFYASEFARTMPNGDRSIDLSFVGTLHSGRYEYVRTLFVNFPQSFTFFYVQARWVFYLNRLLRRDYLGVDLGAVSFDKMDRADVATLFQNSKAVFDLQRKGQTGLTMRTFEVLAAGSMLITTNANIRRENFFDPRRIVLLPETDADSAVRLVRAALSSYVLDGDPPVGFEKFSLQEWTKTLLA